jgi:hypothetical protein
VVGVAALALFALIAGSLPLSEATPTTLAGTAAGPVLQISSAVLDRPTLTNLGVQVLILGDDNHNASIIVRFRKVGSSSWQPALPLHRVRPEVVTGLTVLEQFAGSIFDLRPATSYEIELHATDADGAVNQTLKLTGTTRPVPRGEPASPTVVPVSNAAGLASALSSASPGDVITLANGTYAGSFSLYASGTVANPIVIRGASRDGVILDGQNCASCNVLEVYGDYVHVERLTIQNAQRALRFQGTGAIGNVVRRIRTVNTRLGIGSKPDQLDFYICDNILTGRLAWPSIYTDDGGAHSDDDGIRITGHGHVICHNQIKGFGDLIKIGQEGARAIDFYGNELLSAYDNGVELDGSTGNTRCLRNRFTNNFVPLSFQPIYGGPAYAIRNVAVNIAHEQFKFHALGADREPSGMILWHNSFVSPDHAIVMSTSETSHYFTLMNNLFVGPSSPLSGRTVEWDGPISNAKIDYNGYYPDGTFRWDFPAGYSTYASFAAMQADSMEVNGVLLDGSTFESGLTAPASYTTELLPQDLTLAVGDPALDRAAVLANINDDFLGAGPDLGALELGCAQPIYGPRPVGVDESNQSFGCGTGMRFFVASALPW